MKTPCREASELELVSIYEISKLLSSSLDLHRTLRGVLSILASHLQMRRAMVCLTDADGLLKVVAASELSTEEIERGRFLSGEGVVGKIFNSGLPAVVPDVTEEPLFLNRTGSRSMDPDLDVAFLGVPIKIGRQTVGVLSVDREGGAPHHGYRTDMRFLSMVANLIGQAVRLNQQVAQERQELLHEKRRLQTELQGRYSIDNVIGYSKRMQEVFAEVHQAAPMRSTILLRGESGTGKEVIARAIHYLSPRAKGPFVKLNCAALPETLLESELFGHEKGAFTGATHERKGRFEQAHGGTLFLDEIGDISPAFQAKLLRVLQEREFERLGGNRTIKVDVRLITATNRNLEEAVAKGEFRNDLYYRINVVSIFLPPLRERREDIPFLVDYFLQRFNKDNDRELTMSPEAMEIFVHCNWPGNVRELENCVERASTMARSKLIRDVDLRCQKGVCFSSVLHDYGGGKAIAGIPVQSRPMVPKEEPREEEPEAAEVFSADQDDDGPLGERDRLIWAMEKCGWVQAKAARLLNLTPRQVGYALKKYNVSVKRL